MTCVTHRSKAPSFFVSMKKKTDEMNRDRLKVS